MAESKLNLDPSSSARILIIRLTALGDVVYALPALAALRRHCPKAHVAWAVEEAAAGLLQGHPQLDELIVVPRKTWQKDARRGRLLSVIGEMRRFRRQLRLARFDYAIDFQGNLRGAMVARASGARHTIGFAPPCNRERAHLLLNRRIAVDPALHKLRRNLALLDELGVPTAGAAGVIPEPDAAARSMADDILRQIGAGTRFALIHPGVSRFGSFKQWPAENYAQLCAMLDAEGLRTVLSAGPGEEGLAAEIAERAGGAAVAKGLSLQALAHLMRQAAVVIGSDTGPIQMAWMAGTPTVALMGPKDPAVYGPLGEQHRRLVAEHLPCRPCRKRQCDDNRCMKEIAAEAVLAAAISIAR